MILFDQLRISDDGQTLFIDAHVNESSYYDAVYMDSITICTESEISELTPEEPGSKFIYQADITSESGTKEIHLVLNKASFDAAYVNTNSEGSAISEGAIALEEFGAKDLSSNMFFVYIHSSNVPSECTPCTLDNEYSLGVTFDYGVIYNAAMGYTRELAEECVIPKKFIDFILNNEALKISLETEHYTEAVEYWDRLLNGCKSGSSVTVKPCGCHGGFRI